MTAIRAAHAATVLGHPADELAETFFNSITRRVLHTEGTNQAVEYLDFRFERIGQPDTGLAVRAFTVERGTREAVRGLLAALPFAARWAHRAEVHGAAARCAAGASAGGSTLRLTLGSASCRCARSGWALSGRASIARGCGRARHVGAAFVGKFRLWFHMDY